MASVSATTTGRREIIALQGLVVFYLALRLYFQLKADLVSDEPYYWMWGQHLGWSYFDHPPLHAWLMRLMSVIFGWHPFSVRILTWFTLAGVMAIFWNWAQRLAPDNPQLWFWRTAAIYLSSPLFFAMTMIAYNDHLLVFFCLLAVHCFIIFVDRAESERPRGLLWLYLAALTLGAAVLTKYNGAFIGLGFLAAFIARPKIRGLLRTPHPWLAALLAIAMQAPVVYWNLTEGLASFRYHLSGRWGDSVGHFSWLHPVNFILLCIILWSPFLIWPLVRLLRSKPLTDFEARAKAVAVTVFVVSSLCFLIISCFLDAYFYWNIVAFVGLTPLLTRFMGPVLRISHYAFGVLIAGLIVFNFTVTPVGDLVGRRDRGSSSDFGWTEVGEHMRAVAATTAADFYAGTRYSTTAQLGFVLGTADAVKLSDEHSQYDYWQGDGTQYAGKSALVLADEPDGSPRIIWLQAHFKTLTQVDSFDTIAQGRSIYTWRILRGEGYIP